MFQSTASPTSDVFFFMCFFVNNQFRIIVEESSTGSDNLEDVFESNLKRIGRMVAILDNWDQPVYLSRVWTVYEQFVASTIQIRSNSCYQSWRRNSCSTRSVVATKGSTE
eukprot:Skav222055  [mRNA]  locus=scaffold1020:555809:557225:- [translate_table: standard]